MTSSMSSTIAHNSTMNTTDSRVLYELHERTLDVYFASISMFHYQPSLPMNVVLLSIFAISLVVHIAQGLRWRTWEFVIAMVLGDACKSHFCS
jgi:succinate dehydrogenase/fumarate reductase cytochrome b subunit